MKFTHIRHASHMIEYKGKLFIIDPVLSDKGTISALPKGRVRNKNPLVSLPFHIEFVNKLDGVFITHTHSDHFDKVAQKLIPKTTPIFCHPRDVKKIKSFGFTNIEPIDEDKIIFGSIQVKATKGKHGVGLAGKIMGQTTGYILSDISNHKDKESSVYIIGDSIWYDYIKDTIKVNRPDVIIAFAGEARLAFGKPITMSTDDINHLAIYSSQSKIIVVHLDTWNHCFLTRHILKSYLKGKDYENRVLIPDDGETIVL